MQLETTGNVRLWLSSNLRLSWLRNGFRLLAVLMAGLHTWAAATSQSMNPDGVAYLDIGDAYFRRNGSEAINSVWSPLYSWVLGAVLWLFRPSMEWEFPTVHIVNFAIFIIALCAFEFMWGQLAKAQQEDIGLQHDWISWPAWAWWSIGYLLLIWAALCLIQIWSVTPDMLMAACVFCAAGLIAGIRRGHDHWHSYALLGCALALGYLSKAIMFPVSLLLLAAASLAATDIHRTLWRSGVALLVLLLIGGPFVLLMSRTKGYFTYGEAGKFTYVRHVNGVPYPHWQGEPEGDGVPLHPSRLIFDNPPIYEFGTPIGGTYPIAYDQTYWYDGVLVRFNFANQIRQLLISAFYYVDLFVYQQAAILFSLILIYALYKRPNQAQQGGLLNRGRALLLSGIGLLGLLLYAPILVAGRYVGAFVILFWSDLLAQARVPNSPTNRRIITSLSILSIAFLTSNILLFNVKGFNDLQGNSEQPHAASTGAGAPARPVAVAEELWRLGVDPGDRVAVIGYGFDAFWARLARTKIVAEMLEWEATPFWLGDFAFQQEVLSAFASTGAQAVVAENVPAYANLPGWHRVGESSYYIYLLDTPPPDAVPSRSR